MEKQIKTAVSPRRDQDFAQWYQQVIKVAELAEHSPTRGCMTIKPWGYAIWEQMRDYLNQQIKSKKAQNMYCPLLIPLSFLQKEANHVDGFATECAVVTHHKLTSRDGVLEPDGKLTEPMVIRPTSETMFGDIFSRWIQSYRDLPLKLNQWANVMRWEMRPRLFLRTAEFLWQEGHTAHASHEEAIEMVDQMAEVYRIFVEEMLAIPVIVGDKSPCERFAGAERTVTLEAMMHDGKAIQACTSHDLGQNFAKACHVQYQDKDSKMAYAWTTSWGITTRMIGGLIMTHGDDDGLRLPPRIAPIQCVVIPVNIKDEHIEKVGAFLDECTALLDQATAFGQSIRYELDDSDQRAVDKKWSWVKKGVPIRLEVGMREADNKTVSVISRLDGKRKVVPLSELKQCVSSMLESIQHDMFQQALAHRQSMLKVVTDPSDFQEKREKDPRGFILVPWAGSDNDEEQLSQTAHSIRVMIGPESQLYKQLDLKSSACIVSGQVTASYAVIAQSY